MRYTAENYKSRTAGWVATAVYVAIWLLLIIFVTFKVNAPDLDNEGILINFGDGETGFGDNDLRASDQTSTSQTAPRSSSPAPDNFATQDIEDAPEVVAQPVERPRETQNRPTPAETPQNSTPTPPVEQPRQVDQRALFPGRSNGDAQSEGTAGGAGNQGNLAGAPEGSHEGTGIGTGGDRWNLSGRSLIGALPKPVYSVQEEGRVIIEIHVDQKGNVTKVLHISRGSTTTNRELVSAAERAAKQAKFNVDETAPFPQVGTITYNFKIN